MKQLKRGRVLTLPVEEVKVINGRTCYIVTYDDGEICKQYPISLLRFQLNSEDPIPDTLRCIVKDVNNATGDFSLVQDFSPYIQRFYQIGNTYDFTVVRTHGYMPKKNKPASKTSAKEPEYIISDSYGFSFNLKTSPTSPQLYSYQRIRCKVTEMSGAYLGLKLEEKNDTTTTTTIGLPKTVSEHLNASDWPLVGETNEFVDFLFDAQSEREFDEDCTEWLQSIVKNHLTSTSSEDEGEQSNTDVVEMFMQKCLSLLEQSNVLKHASSSERELLQNRLSIAIDVANRYVDAMKKVEQASHEKYIDDIIDCLNSSGYLYQPQHKLGVLVTLFSLKPELMDSRMGQIFDIIQESPLEYWKQEPFRSAFIKLIEMYVSSARAKADFAAMGGEQVAQIIRALAMELCLVQTLSTEQKKSLPCDLQLNRARLYRYASFASTKYQRSLLELSFRCLMGLNGNDSLGFSWEDTKNVEVLADKLASNDKSNSEQNASSSDDSLVNSLIMKTYKGDKMQLRIGDAGIQIAPLDEEECEPALPDDLLPWHQQQILVNERLTSAKQRTIKSLSGKNNDDLNTFQSLWADIEVALMTDKPKVNKMEPIKTYPDQGDEVDVRIDMMLEGYTEPTFHCIIEMDNVKGDGVLPLSEIVNWNPRIGAESFLNSMGEPYIFPVKVVSVKPNGQCKFTMIKLIREFLHENISYGTQFTMLVKSVKGNGLNGVSAEGYPLNATIVGEPDAPVSVGDYVIVEMETDDDMRHGNISTTFVQHSHRCSWDEYKAFGELMSEYAYVDTYHESLSEEKEVLEADAQLDSDYVREIMLLLDRQSAVESTLRAYSYLGMARIFALLLNDDYSMQYYRWRMELLKMLHEFSINDKVDESKLAEFEKAGQEALNNNSIVLTRESQLYLRFMQLLIVSYRNCPEHNGDLWDIIKNEKDSKLQELASLVLSLNLMKGFDLERPCIEVNNKIFDKLNLKQRTSTRKNYGKENKMVEFKTSLVYPPENNMRPNIQQQIQTMLKVLCAFMNAQGGTLYIGVNNEGMAVGIENDLAFNLFQYSPDKYDVYFHNKVKLFLGLEANSLIETNFEENEDGTTVYVVTVKPYSGVMSLSGTVYERQSTSCEPLSGSYLEAFRANRLNGTKTTTVYSTSAAATTKVTSVNEDTSDEEPTVETTPETTENITQPEEPTQSPAPAEEPVKAEPQASQNKPINKVATGQLRNNVLFTWEENYEEPIVYIQFLANSKYQLVSECYVDDAELTLGIHENERNAYLILAYEDGSISKVSLKEIIAKDQYKEYQYAEKRLVFACPAFDNDIIFSTLKAENGLSYYRTDKVADFDKVNITSSGTKLYTLLDYSIEQAEIVSGEHGDVYRQTPGRSMGVATVKGDGAMMRKNMEELGYNIVM